MVNEKHVKQFIDWIGDDNSPGDNSDLGTSIRSGEEDLSGEADVFEDAQEQMESEESAVNRIERQSVNSDSASSEGFDVLASEEQQEGERNL